jgi:hypothetical protein
MQEGQEPAFRKTAYAVLKGWAQVERQSRFQRHFGPEPIAKWETGEVPKIHGSFFLGSLDQPSQNQAIHHSLEKLLFRLLLPDDGNDNAAVLSVCAFILLRHLKDKGARSQAADPIPIMLINKLKQANGWTGDVSSRISEMPSISISMDLTWPEGVVMPEKD